MQKENRHPIAGNLDPLPSLCSFLTPFVAGFIALSTWKVAGKVLHRRYLMKRWSCFYELLYGQFFFLSFFFPLPFIASASNASNSFESYRQFQFLENSSLLFILISFSIVFILEITINKNQFLFLILVLTILRILENSPFLRSVDYRFLYN